MDLGQIPNGVVRQTYAGVSLARSLMRGLVWAIVVA